MSKVPPSRLPPRLRQLSTPQRPSRSRAPKAEQAAKPKLGGKGGASDSGDADASDVPQIEGGPEQRGGPEHETDRGERPLTQGEAQDISHADEDARAEAHEEAEKQEERRGDGQVRGNQGARGGQPQNQKGQPPGLAAKSVKDLWNASLGQVQRDGFEKIERKEAKAAEALRKAEKTMPTGTPLPPSRGTGGGALGALHQAKEPGVYFKDQGPGAGAREEDEDPELAEAVEECIRLLFGVRGIHRVGPGENDAGQPVVLIVANRGFGRSSLASIPPKVHRFDTLLALPYELLPLRRDI